MKYEKSCGCIVLDKEHNKVLLIKHNEGHWDFPKGHMEEGENEIQTAIRETKEETNIDVKIDENYRYKINYSPKENVTKDVIYYLATKTTEEAKPQLSEVSDVEWVNINDAIGKITYDNSRNVLKQLLKDLNI